MANTTFSGPVRSEGGFQVVTKSATTGEYSTTAVIGGTSLVTAGAGITAGTDTVYTSSVSRNGGTIVTQIMVDLTGLEGAGTADDIIGVNAAADCHLGQITAAVNGTILAVRLTCLEAPAGGNADIDVYSAVESTGVENAAISGLTSTLLVNGAAQTLGKVTIGAGVPAADEYLYLTCGTATDATFTAGKLLIELFGYDA